VVERRAEAVEEGDATEPRAGSTRCVGSSGDACATGHTVRVFKDDGAVEMKHFTLAEGAVMLDPDVKAAFPDSEAVNRALRTLGLPRSA
jgi:hypothetical protein